MADLVDVEMALAAMITEAVYPNGMDAPSVTGKDIYIGRGWPVSQEVNPGLREDKAEVTVYPLPDMASLTTRFERVWKPVARQAPPLHAVVEGSTASLLGSSTPGLLVGARARGAAYVVKAAAGDTPASLAASLAALAPGATATGATIAFQSSDDLAVRVGMPQVATLERRRQRQAFQLSVWAPSPEARDAIGRAIDGHLDDQDFLPLPGGTSGRLLYGGTSADDRAMKASLWIRHFRLTVDYPSVQTKSFQQALFPEVAVNSAPPLIP
ncbi:conserved protein of unknown function (plasmid) [Rhodovastum atsumiense]|uniref:Uncharacterized protein n=1 Tax=Rhodovastum atsumiense TaxID=504468 RepID=A0A5M6IWX7_9PROT|nr:hypothetical protein [Rhodovastum atsumiense]KAA5611875.1 hypothetical protein F1189_12645 [Rhodovastum atsumiense]CAH2606146.1 conserved protein of unknown function [Rhodovastum atsumiense]